MLKDNTEKLQDIFKMVCGRQQSYDLPNQNVGSLYNSLAADDSKCP